MMADEFGYHQVVKDLRVNFFKGVLKSPNARIKQLSQFKLLLDEGQNELFEAVYKDLHKCQVEANLMELLQVKIDLGHALESVKEWMKPQKAKPDLINRTNTCEIRHEPYGVTLIVGAWNYPIYLTFLPLIGALSAGNCAIIKPSELSPNTAKVIEKLVGKYLSQDCVRVINGGIPETQALLRTRFDHIFYTGSPTVGKIVMKAASEHLTPVVLELGGKCPAVVDATCSFDVVAQRIAWAKFCNNGQTCLAVDYILCIGDCQERIVASLKKAIIKFYGKDPKKSDSYGRIINKRHHQRICRLINPDKVAYGNVRDEDDLYISPTILGGVTTDDAVMSEEIFGPILPIVTVDSVEAAVNFINSREKPLALYAFSNNSKTIDAIQEGTSSGGFCGNDALVQAAVPSLPFGGVGYSGMGAYHGKHSFECFSHRKACMFKNQMLENINGLRYPPYDENWKVYKYLEWLLIPSGKARQWFNSWMVALVGAAFAIFYFFFKK